MPYQVFKHPHSNSAVACHFANYAVRKHVSTPNRCRHFTLTQKSNKISLGSAHHTQGPTLVIEPAESDNDNTDEGPPDNLPSLVNSVRTTAEHHHKVPFPCPSPCPCASPFPCASPCPCPSPFPSPSPFPCPSPFPVPSLLIDAF